MKKLIHHLVFILAAQAVVPSAKTDAPPVHELKLQAEYLGEFKVTGYRSVPNQTDSSPFWTSIGIHTNPYLVAASQDLLKSRKVKYGDVIYIEEIGFKHVGDCMNKRIKTSLDIWVETYAQEKELDVKYRSRKLKVWVIRG